jgi:hypothetical protein
MSAYLDALNAMHDLLHALDEQEWRSWIAQDIREWESRQSTRHHLSAYGGMGSFNDIGFDDVWLGTLFVDLRGLCYHLAKHATGALDLRCLELSLGRMGFELSGWRCLACAYGVVSRRNLDAFIARRVIRSRILSAVAGAGLREFVVCTIQANPRDALYTPENVLEWITNGAIHIRDSTAWLRPCPNCASDDTAVYRWSLLEEPNYQFVPSQGNLPLRTDSN